MLAPSQCSVKTVRLTRFCCAFLKTKNVADDLGEPLNPAGALLSALAAMSWVTPAESKRCSQWSQVSRWSHSSFAMCHFSLESSGQVYKCQTSDWLNQTPAFFQLKNTFKYFCLGDSQRVFVFLVLTQTPIYTVKSLRSHLVVPGLKSRTVTLCKIIQFPWKCTNIHPYT